MIRPPYARHHEHLEQDGVGPRTAAHVTKKREVPLSHTEIATSLLKYILLLG